MIDFFNNILNFLNSGLYDFATSFMAWVVQGISYMWLKSQLSAMVFAWDIGQKLLDDLNLSQYMQQAMSHFDSDTLKTLYFFKVPEVLNNVIGAYSARFVMRVLGL